MIKGIYSRIWYIKEGEELGKCEESSSWVQEKAKYWSEKTKKVECKWDFRRKEILGKYTAKMFYR